LSFPRRRESRNVLLKKLDARLRGHDGKTPQTLILKIADHVPSLKAGFHVLI
jgi:hypothetical protein